ncbi:SDR family oxidoreductase [Synechococcus sp. UW105]|uniref:dTDP-4-dehydrorhamnose reductase family protein n=1 Tax=Synechococcus sp. UW105 TaxID=337067 RepID=UPI000E0F0325|nr:SDR family oxidoreductase [Synechococcus sp. UW105]
MKTLILGGSGLIGSTILSFFADHNIYDLHTICRKPDILARRLPDRIRSAQLDATNFNQLRDYLKFNSFDVVINCAGLTKHLPNSSLTEYACPVNSYLPHFLANNSIEFGFHLIHISSDCVFAGSRGDYSELDSPDALDVYGKSKHLGEVSNIPNVLTLRTSTVGHELSTSYGLLEWFLRQDKCNGFKNAFFSGLTTLELSQFLHTYLLSKSRVSGLLNLAGPKIDKFTLLDIVKNVYNRDICILPDSSVSIDRSLNSKRLQSLLCYNPPTWLNMIKAMHAHHNDDGHKAIF